MSETKPKEPTAGSEDWKVTWPVCPHCLSSAPHRPRCPKPAYVSVRREVLEKAVASLTWLLGMQMHDTTGCECHTDDRRVRRALMEALANA